MRHSIHLLWLPVLFAGIVALAQDDDSAVLPITADTNYQVRPADTLDTIGALFDVSPTCLAETNDIARGRDLRAGQTLLISISCPVYGGDARDQPHSSVLIPREVVTFEDDCTGYRVQRNDSVDLIAFNQNISAVSIIQANELEAPYNLEINQCLVIPEDAPPYGVYPALQTTTGDIGTGGALPPGELYVMQPRDTLDVVAQQKNVSVVAIMLANNITDATLLQPGTQIVIPEDAPAYGMYPAINEPVFGTLYVVQQGETLDNIAQAFDVALVALEAANNVEAGRNVPVGTTVLIPDNVPTYGNDADFDPSMLGQGGGFAGTTHVVQPRETVDQIAAFYNFDTRCLLEANQITYPPSVKPGDVLIIDETCGPYIGAGRANLDVVTSPADTTSGAGGGAAETETPTESTEAQPLGETTPVPQASPEAPTATEEVSG